MNAFEQACITATKKRWCWNLSCSTCGQQDFTRFFMSQCNVDDRFDLSLYNGTAMDSFMGANLKTISDQCRFPDWLGYLGLVSARFNLSNSNSRYRTLSTNWAEQLLLIVPSESRAHRELALILIGEETMTPDTMGMCEQAMI